MPLGKGADGLPFLTCFVYFSCFTDSILIWLFLNTLTGLCVDHPGLLWEEGQGRDIINKTILMTLENQPILSCFTEDFVIGVLLVIWCYLQTTN